ncbi:thioredoxin family protein (plasmid) [Bacillus cereus]|uniref:thioredoxin family protein n=1 Tax=Bacillus cereus TaxID=1396 RepID=UPI001F48951B|nr:thioredoxin family protein [Bacillus cereus]UIJ69627.1 thioredoxin family protein [Bacillus cereus]
MKKMFIFGGSLIILFATILIIVQIEKQTDSTNTQKDNVSSSQINSSDYYTNKISFSNLQKNLEENKEEIIYFYQTSCVHCQKISPIIVPMAQHLNIDMKVMDIETLDGPWDEYKITGTPTIIHFKEGKESSRISGKHSRTEFKKWFEQIKTK